MPRSVVDRIARYSNGNGELDLDFRQIAVTAEDVRSGQFVAHDVNTRDVNYVRYRQECLREGIDPHTAVEVEALSPGAYYAVDSATRSRPKSTTSGSGTSSTGPKKPNGSCCEACKTW